MQDFAKINQKQTNFCNLEFPLKTKYHFLKKENKNVFIYFSKFLQGRGVREKCNNFYRDLLIRKLIKLIHFAFEIGAGINVPDQQVPDLPGRANDGLITGPSSAASNYC